MYAKNIETPLIHKKMEYIFKKRQFLPKSYDYNEVIRIFNDIPKHEIFRLTKEELLDMVDFIMSITNPNHIQCLKRYSVNKQQLKLYFVIPYYFFNPDTVQIISQYVCDLVPSAFKEILPIRAPEKCRIHFHFKLNGNDTLPDEETIERVLTQLIQPWKDQVEMHLQDQAPDILSQYPNIIDKIPSHYRVKTKPASAVRDLTKLLSLSPSNPIAFELFSFDFPKTSDLAGKASMLLVYHKTKLNLTNILPILHHCGIHVIDQITSRFGDSHTTIGFIHAFRILSKDLKKLQEDRIKERLIEALTCVFNHTLENDPLNQLILTTNMTPSNIFLLQALRNYCHQISQGGTSKTHINDAIIRYPAFAEHLTQRLAVQFKPKLSKSQRQKQLNALSSKIKRTINSVSSISDDQLLRKLDSIVHACLRCNLFIKQADEPLSFKFDCDKIMGMPTPVPFKEIFVYDYHLEGVHIRFGSVARGGLRWSNRHNDYRTEVLGLAKTQQAKNAVIIPVGSKGGFVIKHMPQPLSQDDGIKQYKRFIAAMLQITDNLQKNKAITPKNLVCYDTQDPYFVVAADKGTATFSDYANQVSLDNEFWLGDGFASGGAQGYDHKKVGITAKGAWECCKLHFKDMAQHPEKDPISVIGVGDMSGDVFGNGMLLSKSMKLLAAFNHMHIFIDPTPDPKKSWKERQRLFKLPRSSWTDYQGISNGGGVFDRNAKSIPCSIQMQQLLGITDKALSGDALIKALLIANVDLLWFGGIGTYIKSTTESNLDAGDPANNTVRVNAMDVQASVIAEGANLGLTQLARLEFESGGGRINTDAIDNSAGVNMSDYEVNIKILLSSLQQVGNVKTDTERNQILEDATDAVTDLVLQNNVSQHHIISMDQVRSKTQPYTIENTIRTLINEGRLSVIDENIPNSKERDEFYKHQLPIPRPVLAKCMAYTKLKIKEKIMDSPLFTGNVYHQKFYHYFPVQLQTFLNKKPSIAHRLKHDIIITQLTNHAVELFGTSTYERLTFGQRISIDQGLHQLNMIESIFNFNAQRIAYNSEPNATTNILALNETSIQCSFVCYLLNIPLTEKHIPVYQKMLKRIENKQITPAIACILFTQKNIDTARQRISTLEDRMAILSNISLLQSLSVKNKTHATEKTSLMSDLFHALHQFLSLPEADFNTTLEQTNGLQLNKIIQTNDTLSHLFIYSFNLREVLKSRN